MSKFEYKKYESFSWKEERRELMKSGVAIVTIPVSIWCLCYLLPFLYFSEHFSVNSQKSLFNQMLPNIIMVGVGGLLMWLTMQLYGNTIRRYLIPMYMRQKVKEWKNELKHQKKDLKVRKSMAKVLDETLFKEEYINEEELCMNAFKNLKTNYDKLQLEIKTLEESILKQEEELHCFELVIVPKALFQKISAMVRYPFEYWKGYIVEPDIFPIPYGEE